MTKKTGTRSMGWLALEIVIGILVVLLLLSIHIPKKQWEDHISKEELCRQRIENLYFASHFYSQKNKSFNQDIAALLSYAESGSLKVYPPGFKLDRLTRTDSGIDSFTVDYFDPYPMFSHFTEVPSIRYPAGKDSLVLEISPLPDYSFLPTTQYTFAAQNPISVFTDDRGDQGKFLLVGSHGLINRQQLLAEIIVIPANKYIYNITSENVEFCPSTHTAYKTWVNVKIAIMGEMTGTISDSIPETPLSSSSLLSSMLVYRWLKQSDGMANATLVQEKTFEVVEDSMIIAWNKDFLDKIGNELRSKGKDDLAIAIHDSLLDENEQLSDDFVSSWESIRDNSYTYMNSLKEIPKFMTIRDNIVNDIKSEIANLNLSEFLETARNDGKLSITETGVINTSNDSIQFYSDSDLIKNQLFVTHNDSVTKSYLNRTDISELLSQFNFTETYDVSRVDSTGITILCPIDGEFISSERSMLEIVFSVEGETIHGRVDDGDLSWSDKR